GLLLFHFRFQPGLLLLHLGLQARLLLAVRSRLLRRRLGGLFARRLRLLRRRLRGLFARRLRLGRRRLLAPLQFRRQLLQRDVQFVEVRLQLRDHLLGFRQVGRLALDRFVARLLLVPLAGFLLAGEDFPLPLPYPLELLIHLHG